MKALIFSTVLLLTSHQVYAENTAANTVADSSKNPTEKTETAVSSKNKLPVLTHDNITKKNKVQAATSAQTPPKRYVFHPNYRSDLVRWAELKTMIGSKNKNIPTRAVVGGIQKASYKPQAAVSPMKAVAHVHKPAVKNIVPVSVAAPKSPELLENKATENDKNDKNDTATAKAEGMILQVGAFRTDTLAETQAARVSLLGIPARVVKLKDAQGNLFRVVRSRQRIKQDEAEQIMSRLREHNLQAVLLSN